MWGTLVHGMGDISSRYGGISPQYGGYYCSVIWPMTWENVGFMECLKIWSILCWQRTALVLCSPCLSVGKQGIRESHEIPAGVKAKKERLENRRCGT